ncbi:hypothetical protein Tco_0505135 [Tanacetum coccineum]
MDWLVGQVCEGSEVDGKRFRSAKRAIHNEPAAVGPGKVVVGPSTAVVGPVVAPNGKLLVLVSDDTKGYLKLVGPQGVEVSVRLHKRHKWVGLVAGPGESDKEQEMAIFGDGVCIMTCGINQGCD